MQNSVVKATSVDEMNVVFLSFLVLNQTDINSARLKMVSQHTFDTICFNFHEIDYKFNLKSYKIIGIIILCF